MTTQGSASGGLRLEYRGNPGDSAGYPLPIDVIGEDFRAVDSAPKLIELGKPLSLPLGPGSYLVRAFLPSGEVVTRQARVEAQGETVVAIQPAKPSPSESLTWAYILKSIPDGGCAALNRIIETAPADAPRAPENTRPDIEMRLWTHDSSRPNAWERVVENLPLDRGASLDDPNALAEATINVGRGQSWLEVRGESFPSRFVALAPNASGRTQVLVVADDRSEPAFDPVDLMVSLGDRRAEAILSYLSRGSIEEAHRIGDSFVDQAEKMLKMKEANPIAATVAGYYLLKASALPKLHDWTANLARKFRWLPDGPVIRAWHLLRLPNPNTTEIRDLLVDAVARGLPLFTEGLRLLNDGLGLVARSEPDDPSAGKALESIRPYAASANWSALMTTFYGDDPKQPKLPSASPSETAL